MLEFVLVLSHALNPIGASSGKGQRCGYITEEQKADGANGFSAMQSGVDSREIAQCTMGDEKIKVNTTSKYQAKLANTIFCPCPRGNKMESFRLTEALNSGCIPILDDDGVHFHHAWPGIDEYVITTTVKWESVRLIRSDGLVYYEPLLDYVVNLIANPVALNKRYFATIKWYQESVRRMHFAMQSAISSALTEGGGHDMPGVGLPRLPYNKTAPSVAAPKEPPLCASRFGLSWQEPLLCQRFAFKPTMYCKQLIFRADIRQRCPIVCGVCRALVKGATVANLSPQLN
jgi:hypothetical protein